MWFEIYATPMSAPDTEEMNKQPWHWRLKNRNGRISAVSGEGYSSKSGCRRAINGLKHELRFVDVAIRYSVY